MAASRDNFGSRFSVIMAMAGSAIGLGNIWRFPYIMGQGGGAAFIVVYLLATIFLSMPILLSESIIGRRTQSNAFGAMDKLAPGTKWKYIGLLSIFSPLVVLSYYSVVGGWSVDYLLRSLTLEFTPRSMDSFSATFGSFISSVWGPLVCHTAFLAMTAIIVGVGVKKGIEKFAVTMMPLLFVLMVVILIYSVSLPGAKEGIEYLIRPDFSKLNGSTIAAAVGQAFFSMSLGVGVMLVYASYIKKDENLLASGMGSAGFDMLFALISGFAVMPAVFAAGIAPGSGPGLVFESLPYVFASMGLSARWLSAAVAILFFFSILIAALSSSISMLEAGVAYLVEEKHFSRWKAVAVLFCCTWVVGTLCSLSFGPLKGFLIFGSPFFEFCDKLTSNFLMAIGGLLFSVFVGWKMNKADVRDEFTNGGTKKLNATIFPFVLFLIRFVVPLGIIAIFITTVLL